MGYGAAGTGIGKDLGFREITPQCEPGPDFEACRQETIVEGSAVVLVVVAAVVLVGSTCWLVLLELSPHSSVFALTAETKLNQQLASHTSGSHWCATGGVTS